MRVPRADQSAACTVRWRGSWRGFWGLKGFVTGRYVGRVKGYSCVVALKLGVECGTVSRFQITVQVAIACRVTLTH
jgi:hypothetical protein